MAAAYKKTVDIVRTSQSFLVTSHIDPDGDAVGCELAILSVLSRLGKNATGLLEDPVPPSYVFLEGAAGIVTSSAAVGQGPWDAAIVVDSATLERTGWVADAVKTCGAIINIDHHGSNTYFGTENVVETEVGACGEIVYRVIGELGAGLETAEAEALYVAILSDTGCFRFPSTTGSTLKIAAHLLDLGVKPYHAASEVYWRKSLPSLKILGEALRSMEVTDDGMIATMEVTRAMYRDSGATGVDAEGFANYPRSINGVAVGALLRETDEGHFRVSLRAAEGYDVDAIAKVFGGGGHTAAAGFRIDGDLESIKARVRGEISSRLASRAKAPNR
jgi:phosphoesterase RecJ-like protein